MARGGRSSSRSSGRSSGRSFFGSRSPPNRAPPRQNYQQSTARPQQPVMAPQQTMPMQPQGGMMGGIGSTIVTGMALGAGSEIGHQAVRGLMGGSGHGSHHNNDAQHHEPQQQQQPQEMQPAYQPLMSQQMPIEQNNSNGDRCFDYSKMFKECMSLNFNNTSICSQSFEDLKKCQNNLV